MVPGRTDPFALATGRAAWVTTLLLAAILLASCARAGEQQAGAPVATATPALAATPTWTAASPITPAETGSSTPVPVATSRGPNLEATDPASVRLDSGGLQLVEFFRFT